MYRLGFILIFVMFLAIMVQGQGRGRGPWPDAEPQDCGIGWELALVLPPLMAWRARRRAGSSRKPDGG